MPITVEMQRRIALRGATGWTGIGAELEDWLDTSAHSVAAVQVELPFISGCTLYLEGCDQSGGSFTTHAALDSTSIGSTMVYLKKQAPYGASDRLNNLLRWRVIGPGTPSAWEACFRITVVFK